MATDLRFETSNTQRPAKLCAYAVDEDGAMDVHVEITSHEGRRQSLATRLSPADARAMGHALLALADCSPVRV